MSDFHRAEELTREILDNPRETYRDGKVPNALFKEYRKGYPVENLRPLLRSDQQYVRMSAVFIAAELGRAACPVIEDIVPLLDSADRGVVYDSLRCVTVCSQDQSGRLAKVVSAMDGPDEHLRQTATYFVSNSEDEALRGALKVLESEGDHERHVEGLTYVLHPDTLKEDEVRELLESEDRLLRRYAVIVAGRKMASSPQLIDEAQDSDDPDVEYCAYKIRRRAEVVGLP